MIIGGGVVNFDLEKNMEDLKMEIKRLGHIKRVRQRKNNQMVLKHQYFLYFLMSFQEG